MNEITTSLKRVTVLTLLSIVTTVGAWSQLLWRVTGNGSAGTSYIFGTHHVAPAAMIDSVVGLPEAIATVDQVMVEVENGDLTSPDAQMKMVNHALAPADSVLTALYTPEELTVVREAATPLLPPPLTFDMLVYMKPVMLSTLMQTQASTRYFPDYDPDLQIDAAVQRRVAGRAIPVYSLETVDDQIELLFDTPIRLQADELLEMCANDSAIAETAHKMAQLYRQQDLFGLWQLMIDEEDGEYDPADLDRLIFSRNRKWAERLAEELPRHTTLVAVGAGHLPGEQGLINLLRDRGYTVEPVIPIKTIIE